MTRPADTRSPLSRRRFLGSTAVGGALAMTGANAGAAKPVSKYGQSPYDYEVTRTEEEWRAMLSEEEYKLLREGATEFPTSSKYWNDYSAGNFHCKGCDLHLYSSDWRARIDQGFVFFFHSQVDAVLPGLDTGSPYDGGSAMGNPDNPHRTLIEVHCRRCGSHMGHIVHVEEKLVHCINGKALQRRPLES